MSALSRFGPAVARSTIIQHHRNMASAATATDPIQKMFVEKIREFKGSNKGLDETHKKALSDDMQRLRRIYNVQDETKLAHMEHKFPNEHEVTLRDLDENKERRALIASGEIRNQLATVNKQPSVLLDSIPDQSPREFHLPMMNKPDYSLMESSPKVLKPHKMSGEEAPDYEFPVDKVTPEWLEEQFLVKFGDKMPTIHDDTKPGRDAVNFPRYHQADWAPATRYHIFPESWFQFFYPKTGLTGPYAFFGGFGTFLLSKEWVPFEHEMLTACSTAIIFSYAVIKFGPALTKWLSDRSDEHCKGWDEWQHGNIDTLKKLKQHYTNEMNKGSVLNQVYDIRRQDVEAQLECERRNRIKLIYDDTKRRLNYLVAKADSTRQIYHSNMVNWVISNVLSSIGSQKQENEILDNCVMNLKQLASKNAKSI